jgi:large subunit ribosomal protein L28
LRLVTGIDLKFIEKMSKICQITGKKMMVGNNVSHSKRRTRRTFQPNLFDKKFYLEEEDRYITLRVSAQGIRTINKNGLKATLDDAVKKGFLKSY